MAVLHLTLHAYGTWWPDHLRGYTSKQEGVLPTNPDVADEYRQRAKFETVNFDEPMQRVLIAGGHDICRRREWRCHAIGTDLTHAHFLLSRRGYLDFDFVEKKVKNIPSLFLGRLAKLPGRPWFVEGGRTRAVKAQEHFDYLVEKYLPNHRGIFWKEGNPLPILPEGIL